VRILSGKFRDVKISVISLPCSGKVSSLYLLKAIETGSDGVLLVSCKFGTCKYLQGNYRALRRIKDVDDLLYETGLSDGTIKFISMEEDNKIDAVVTALKNMVENLTSAQQVSQKQSI
jgi:F420-non-reducing hydrogenase iron-sulfur subunit